jgi:hypothetical protein
MQKKRERDSVVQDRTCLQMKERSSWCFTVKLGRSEVRRNTFVVQARRKCYVMCEGRYLGPEVEEKGKAVPLHAMEALGGRGAIAPTHSRHRH